MRGERGYGRKVERRKGREGQSVSCVIIIGDGGACSGYQICIMNDCS